MVDFAGGHPSTEEAAAVIEALDAELGRAPAPTCRSTPACSTATSSWRPPTWADADVHRRRTTSATSRAVWPTGPAAPKLQALMDASPRDRRRLRRWRPTRCGCGARAPSRSCRRSATRHGVEAAWSPRSTSSGGSACSPAWTWSTSRARPAGTTPNYEGKRDAALDALAGGADLFVIHVEATDEAGHAGNLEEKVRALENWDRRILAGLVEGLDAHRPVAPAAAARPRHAGARSRPTPPTRCRTCWSTRRSTAPAASTPSRRPRTVRPSPATSSWAASSA